MGMSRGVVIGGRSKNVGGSSILSTKRRGSSPSLPVANPPGSFTVASTLKANGTYDISASWDAPYPVLPSFLGYTLELEDSSSASPTWANTQNTTALTYTYTSRPSSQYKIRIKSRYSFSDSYWVESPPINAFSNLSLNGALSPNFNTIVFFPNF
jgi:hypothetical protein